MLGSSIFRSTPWSMVYGSCYGMATGTGKEGLGLRPNGLFFVLNDCFLCKSSRLSTFYGWFPFSRGFFCIIFLCKMLTLFVAIVYGMAMHRSFFVGLVLRRRDASPLLRFPVCGMCCPAPKERRR